jgi:hypothetical protein
VKVEKNDGGKNDMVLHIPTLEDFVQYSMKNMPHVLHNDVIKTIKQKSFIDCKLG